MFFFLLLLKTLKTCIKPPNCSIYSSKKNVITNQIKSIILLQNTRCVQEMDAKRNFPMKMQHFVLLCFSNNKNTTLKKHKKHF